MTPQETIDRLHKIPVRPKPDNALDVLAIINACKALEKQIPKKPIKSDRQEIRYTFTYDCPTCGRSFTGTGFADCCYHCGQALDWGDEE